MIFNILPWLISTIVLFLAFMGWGQDLSWQFTDLTAYQLFPLFGLIAFSLMWVHYAVDFIQRFVKSKIAESYLPTTRYIVFFSLLMHPGILAWQQWHDGLGLPPLSWLNIVDSNLQWAVIVGISAWLAFLAFELHWWFRNKSWFKWIIWANSVAMILIVIHAIFLAEPIGWFLWLWYLYGITMIIFIVKDVYDRIYKKTGY